MNLACAQSSAVTLRDAGTGFSFLLGKGGAPLQLTLVGRLHDAGARHENEAALLQVTPS